MMMTIYQVSKQEEKISRHLLSPNKAKMPYSKSETYCPTFQGRVRENLLCTKFTCSCRYASLALSLCVLLFFLQITLSKQISNSQSRTPREVLWDLLTLHKLYSTQCMYVTKSFYSLLVVHPRKKIPHVWLLLQMQKKVSLLVEVNSKEEIVFGRIYFTNNCFFCNSKMFVH